MYASYIFNVDVKLTQCCVSIFLSKSGRKINFKSVRGETPHYLQQRFLNGTWMKKRKQYQQEIK